MLLSKQKRGVLVACDVVDMNRLEVVVRDTCDIEGIVGYKIGFTLALYHSLPAAVSRVRGITDLPVVYDHQKAGTDIPQMGDLFAKVCKHSRVQAAIIFPQSGPETEAAFIVALLKEGLIPIVGGEMTHPKYLDIEGGFIRAEAIETMYVNAAESGVRHFVVPGNRPEKVEKYSRLLSRYPGEHAILMPGIGRQGGEITSSFSAARSHSTYAVIGSAIYDAPNISDSARVFCNLALGVA